jgi:hypothetical protein
MNRLHLLATLGLSAALLAALPSAATPAPVQVTLRNAPGSHLQIVSAYLRAGEDLAIVRGMVRRTPAWAGVVYGHLHVNAYGADGALLAERSVRWSKTFTGREGGTSTYEVNLGVPRAAVARLDVAYAPGAHADEGVVR